MNAGVIQQFGTPEVIYERPANLFVAGFIGAPAMNLKPARITKSSGRVEAVFGTGTDRPRQLRFRDPPGGGCRDHCRHAPRAFRPAERSGDGAAAVFDLPVQYTERTGSDATGYLHFEDGLLLLRVEPGRAAGLEPGQTL